MSSIEALTIYTPTLQYVCCACLKAKDFTCFCSDHATSKMFPKCKECRKLKLPQIYRYCKTCKLIKLASEFDLHVVKCKSCVKVYHEERKSVTEKICSNCKILKPVNIFYDNFNSLDGKSSWCCVCSNNEGRRSSKTCQFLKNSGLYY